MLGRREQLRLGRARHHRGVRARGDAELGRPPPLAARRAAVGNLRREVGVDVELVHVQPGLALEPRAHLGLAALPAERRAVPAARRVGRRAKRRRRRRRRRGGGGRAGGGDGVEAPLPGQRVELKRKVGGDLEDEGGLGLRLERARHQQVRVIAALQLQRRLHPRLGGERVRAHRRHAGVAELAVARRLAERLARRAPLRVGRHEHHHAHLVARVLAALRRRAERRLRERDAEVLLQPAQLEAELLVGEEGGVLRRAARAGAAPLAGAGALRHDFLER